MRCIYRPQKGTLAEAMEYKKEFDDVMEMLKYIVEDHRNAFKLEEISLKYYCYDPRIRWETFSVLADRYFEDDYLKEYGHPCIVGFCTILKD
ncbi:MAG: hypothetical protein IJ334_05980 [Clostridia bacterium]|nr:hypothetical protein [Clostridia bacterium]